MFDAKFQYTNKIINNLMEISSIREFILNSKILPSYDLLLKNKAIISSSYNSTSIEGNPLDFKQVTELFNLKEHNKLDEVKLNRSEIEVVNYFKTLENLDKYEKKFKELKKNYIIGMITDNKVDRIETILENTELRNLFDVVKRNGILRSIPTKSHFHKRLLIC